MSERGKVTIYDLAQRLNTTASTVSRALQNNARISPKMRKAVQDLAAELNYIPDPVAHHLRTGKGNVLGIIVPRIDRHFFATIISSFQETAQKQNFNIIIAASNENAAHEEAAIKALLSKKVDGIAISLSVETKNPRYEELCASFNTPLVYFDRTVENSNTDTVTNDNFQVGYDAVYQLYKIGCRKIAHFAGPQDQKQYVDRKAGYLKALKDLNLEVNNNLIFNNCITLETGTETAQRILNSVNRPDGIFCSGDFSAISAMDIFRKKGVKVPNDIAFIGVANEPFDNFLSTPLSSFDLHQKRIGELAAKILLERINNPEEYETQHVVVKHDLILRDSSI